MVTRTEQHIPTVALQRKDTMDINMRIVTATAPVNIALIKYWGKRDEDLVLPLNDSISFTLSQNEMCAKTTVALSAEFDADQMWLNGREIDISKPRIQNCLRQVRKHVDREKLGTYADLHIHICSVNNFPTAAGLASSAAGYACLAFSLAKLYGFDGDISPIARVGSGSACRSIYGGLVQWFSGEKPDGSDSVAKCLSSLENWTGIHVLICVVNDKKKKTGSTNGMKRTVETSNLYKARISSVTYRIKAFKQAIEEKDWSKMCDITMADSNEMHAVCLDSFPPCIYMNDVSHSIASLVHEYNSYKTKLQKTSQKICYTFDAGPNACLFIPEEVISEVFSLIIQAFPENSCAADNLLKGPPLPLSQLPAELEAVASLHGSSEPLKQIIHTRVGDGPQVITDPSEHLLDTDTGLPKLM